MVNGCYVATSMYSAPSYFGGAQYDILFGGIKKIKKLKQVLSLSPAEGR